MKVLRSPNLRDGAEVCVVRLVEAQPFARGGLVQPRQRREFTLHISEPELKQLKKKWGAPRRNARTRIPEYAFPRDSLKKLERFALGGPVGLAPPPQMSTPLTAPEEQTLGRTRNQDPIDYYTYGMGPEYEFYKGNIAPPAPAMVHLPSTPTGPGTQSVGTGATSGGALQSIGALAGLGATVGDILGQGNNPYVQGAGALGNLASGNYLGAIKGGLGAYNSLTSPSMSDYGSGAAVDQALTDAGFTGSGDVPAAQPASTGLSSKVGDYLSTAGDLYGIYEGIKEGGVKGYAGAAGSAASLAGYDLPILNYVNLADQLRQGDVGNAAVTAASMYVPLAGLGFAATNLINKSFTGHGDEKRNLAAFLEANPLGLVGQVWGPATRTTRMGGWQDSQGRLLSSRYIQDLAGAWYGANVTPDGNKEYWQSEYDKLFGAPVMSPVLKGYEWRDGRFWRGDKPMDTYLNEKKVAHGGRIEGGLSALSEPSGERHVKGPGTGRSDSIPAQLSDGEYVLTAEDVSLLGDGSNEAGARVLDEFRAELRKHKGGALARGKISPNAKSPMEYMRGLA